MVALQSARGRSQAFRFVSSTIQQSDAARRRSSLPIWEAGLLILVITIGPAFAIAGADRGILAAASIAGSALIAWAVFYSNRIQDKIKATLELHRDYYSEPLGSMRAKAIKFFQLHYANDWSERDPYQVEDPENTREGYSEVLRFFHHLSILLEHDRIDKDMATDLFSREMGFWWGFAFCRMTDRSGWWTGPMVYRLARDLNENGGWPNFRRGYKSGRRLRLYGNIRKKLPNGSFKNCRRPKIQKAAFLA